ncbi:MAG: POTRA domain-containing protein [Acidobacteriaceae bacterium]|jgi:outer membrane protein insertion porin family
MKLLRKLAFILFAITGPSFAAPAPPPDLTYTAAKIVFNNPGPYTQAQLEAVAGMHAGIKFKADDLGAAAQRLVDSGFFSDVGATLSGDVNKANVLFDIKPIDHAQMLRVGFENFVWLSHAEIEIALQARAPLFLDSLPESSPLEDVFDAALTDALAAKGIPARVTHETVEPTMLRPERVIEFRIAAPAIHVANVKLEGVAPDLAPLLQKSVNAAAKAAYNEGLAGETTEDRVLAPLLDAGYIHASLSGATLAPTFSGDAASVVLSATLNPGDIYRISSIAFAGTPLLSAESFAASAKLHPGDIASRALLLQTLAPLDAAYRRQGYMDVIVEATPAADPATRQVAYTVTVKPGEQYRIHEVTANNLDPAARADFDRGFLMKAGELYNPEYVSGFLKNNFALQALLGYSATYKAYADPNTHTVDLVLTFIHGAGANVITVTPTP